MMGMARKIARKRARIRLIAADGEFAEERRRLMSKLRAADREVGEPEPMKYLAYLRKKRETYRGKRDGFSALMSLVDDFDALEAEVRG